MTLEYVLLAIFVAGVLLAVSYAVLIAVIVVRGLWKYAKADRRAR